MSTMLQYSVENPFRSINFFAWLNWLPDAFFAVLFDFLGFGVEGLLFFFGATVSLDSSLVEDSQEGMTQMQSPAIIKDRKRGIIG